MSPSPSLPTPESLAGALARALAATLPEQSDLDVDAETLARRLAPALRRELESGERDEPLAGSAPASFRRGDRDSAEARVLAAIARHPAGHSPGLTPDELATITGLAAPEVGPVVRLLVQRGDLVRDAWLVRLPDANDLLPEAREAAVRAGRTEPEERIGVERRGIGDRRLYERRLPEA
jgi:hypothetical protein